jgi:hypothetical protein
MGDFDVKVKSEVEVDFDSVDLDDKGEVRIKEFYPDEEYGDDNLFEYEMPKSIIIEWIATCYISQGLNRSSEFYSREDRKGGFSFSMEVPDQDIQVEYTRRNVITDESETLTATYQLKKIKCSIRESEERKPYGGRLHDGVEPVLFEAYNKTLYFAHEE